MTSVPLNILCQSPVSEGMTPRDAVGHTVALAREAEGLGYHRFWVSEHHSDTALASAAPEVVVAAIAAQTERMRIGSGGVLLPYYTPFKVAEQLTEKLNHNAVLIQLPIGLEEGHIGVVDLVGMRALYCEGDTGETIREDVIPAELQAQADDPKQHQNFQ